MTNKETIDWCRNFQDNLVACKQECAPRYAYALKAMSTAIDALEKADEYRWHDLRENPNDLPDHHEKTVIILKRANCFNKYEVAYLNFKGEWVIFSTLEEVFSEYEKGVWCIAGWKYIEPFEVKE